MQQSIPMVTNPLQSPDRGSGTDLRRCCPNKLCRPSKCFPNRPLRLPNKLRNTKGSSTRSLFSFFYFKMFAFFKNYYLGVEQFNEFIMDSQNIEHALIVNHSFINVQVTHLAGVLGFGGFCFLLGARPQDIPYVYCLFYVIFVPLRWIYYRSKKWHYYLLDFCYYANTIFLIDLLFYSSNEKLFMVCFSFAEGPLAWALIVWRCSLVFSSLDKIVSVLIHLLPGLVFFTIRWWNPATFEAMHPEGTARRPTWPYIEDKSYLWTWLFLVPLVAYTLWQVLYFLIVNVLRRQRLLRDPEVMTSYRELSKKAQKANNIWWRLSGLLGDQNRMLMYIFLQGIFTVATMALTVPIFLSYELHVVFQILKVSASIWNGGSFLLEVMPRQAILKEKKKSEMQPVEAQPNHDHQ
ncbi:glycerophosphocholine acyltransferase 1 isoform X1 [Glycine max]|uniref:glycerophosphocholine acyltransferase 1 isoform X1 n=1 Tax=Glycine max TaxID=3847 RepID=UPI001B3549EF|nr:glycerophosphocholine acyltransferase 1 isoform X1 [Glycine max]